MTRDKGARQSISIQLRRIEDLFTVPAVDPFDAGYQTAAGIEQIAARLAVMRLRRGLNITVGLPASAPRTEGLTSSAQAAIQRYCDATLADRQLELATRRRRTWRNLGVGLLILAVSLGLGAGITRLDFLSAGLRALLSNAVSILGTVALWTPVDAWLFGLRPLQSTIRVYTAIRNASVEIRYADSA
jgi:hypothetical protein